MRPTNGIDASLTQTYGYDELSRLTSVSHWANETLAYDANGNRVQSNWIAPMTMTVDSASNQITRDTAIIYTHDGRGNRKTQSWNGSTATYTFDGFNRLASVSRDVASTYSNAGYQYLTYPAGTTSYEVNALDQRVGKSGVNGTSRFVYGEQSQILAEQTNGVWSSYVWMNGELIGLVRNNALYFVHGDHLGRPELVTDSAKAVVWRAKNYHSERGVALNNIGGLNIGLPGQYFDAESGLWNNGFRDYDSRLGRYVQSDPIGLGGGVNTYAYVSGNPVSLVDPFGLEQGAAYSAIYRADGGVPQTSNIGNHYYNLWIPMCAGGCTPDQAFNAMRNFSAPGAQYAQDGSHNVLLSGLTSPNPINQTVDPCAKTIKNVTRDGHLFGGSVTISIQQRNGVVGAQIIGTGLGPNPIMNQLMGPMVFEYLGNRAAESLGP